MKNPFSLALAYPLSLAFMLLIGILIGIAIDPCPAQDPQEPLNFSCICPSCEYNCPDMQCLPCPNAISKECDNTDLQKCRLQVARLVSESNYYKNLSITQTICNSTEEINEDLKDCRESRAILNTTIEYIKDLVT